MLFMQTQQVQPALHMAIMQSQQAWIIAQQAGSPLVTIRLEPRPMVVTRISSGRFFRK